MKAGAFVVGPGGGSGAALEGLARRAGFARVAAYAGVEAIERQSLATPVCFVFCAAVADIGALRGVAEAVRFSPSRRVRFSPLVYFAESPSLEDIRRCIDLGFDDVITLPVALPRLVERLGRQVGPTLVYYETAGYFGPDRRARLAGLGHEGETARGAGRFRRLEIVRSLVSGISVLRDELCEPA